VGWGFPVAIGDNGFLDILLHVGVVGFALFMGVLIFEFIQAARFARQSYTLASFFPLLFMIYAVMANISFSLFLETETFVWLVMIAVLFAITPRRQPSLAL
jgi:O-antigen ligase